MTYTSERPTHIFDHTTTEAQIGDYFRLPYQPTFRVVALVDLGDIVSYLVQSGSNTPEQWDIQKPTAEIAEQERNRVESEELEAYEREMSAIIYQSSEDEIMELLGLVTTTPERLDWLESDKWLNEPVSAGLDYILGMSGQKQAHYLPPVENAYHDPNWTADGCEF
jgi:hypothetical protein